MGIGDFSPGVKRPRCGAEGKNGGAIPPLHNMYSWLGAYLIKHRNSVTFIFLSAIYRPAIRRFLTK
jgi:hypothetical protein